MACVFLISCVSSYDSCSCGFLTLLQPHLLSQDGSEVSPQIRALNSETFLKYLLIEMVEYGVGMLGRLFTGLTVLLANSSIWLAEPT